MSAHLTYFLLEVGWALPVILLHWLLGGDRLWRRRAIILRAVLPLTVYLSAVDTVAIHNGIWSIDRARTLDLRFGSLVFEEVLFFLLSSLMVVQALLLFLDGDVRRRTLGRARAWATKRAAHPE